MKNKVELVYDWNLNTFMIVEKKNIDSLNMNVLSHWKCFALMFAALSWEKCTKTGNLDLTSSEGRQTEMYVKLTREALGIFKL